MGFETHALDQNTTSTSPSPYPRVRCRAAAQRPQIMRPYRPTSLDAQPSHVQQNRVECNVYPRNQSKGGGANSQDSAQTTGEKNIGRPNSSKSTIRFPTNRSSYMPTPTSKSNRIAPLPHASVHEHATSIGCRTQVKQKKEKRGKKMGGCDDVAGKHNEPQQHSQKHVGDELHEAGLCGPFARFNDQASTALKSSPKKKIKTKQNKTETTSTPIDVCPPGTARSGGNAAAPHPPPNRPPHQVRPNQSPPASPAQYPARPRRSTYSFPSLAAGEAASALASSPRAAAVVAESTRR